jgi:hypothetical protein
VRDPVGCWRAGKNGARKDRPGGSLARAASGRKTARSDYEQQQIVLQLQAVERMKEMVQVRRLTSHTLSPCDGTVLHPQMDGIGKDAAGRCCWGLVWPGCAPPNAWHQKCIRPRWQVA